jgi:regulator of protease activity HflC (stomatin/prohibitin superfamily)
MTYLYIIVPIVLIFLAGIRIVRPTHKGLIERLGKYKKLADPGFHWIIPVIDRLFYVNITEQMVDAEPQVCNPVHLTPHFRFCLTPVFRPSDPLGC